MVKIHYFFDPMCGWCFGASALIESIKATPGIQLEMHPGGMIQRRKMDASFRKMVISHDKKIESLTGQRFGNAYKSRVSGDESVILDSFITAQAIAIMDAQESKGFEMLKAIQIAHFQQGLDVSDIAVLVELATTLGAEAASLAQAISVAKPNIASIVADSHQLMNKWQVNGFPTLILETESEIKLVSHTSFYNNSASWKELLLKIVQSHLSLTIN